MLHAVRKSLSILAVLSVVSCGGGGGDNYVVGAANTGGSSSTNTTNTTTTTNTDTTTTTDVTTGDARIADMEVAASSRQLGSNGSVPVIISAVVKDVNNNTLKDVAVQFSVDNNATIEPDEEAVGGSVKTAKLTPGLNRPENRNLVVKVTAGTQERTIEVEVTGTVIQLDGPERIVINTPAQFVGKLKDSTGKGLSHQLVVLTSAQGNTIEATGEQGFYTDENGEIIFKVTAGVSGMDTLAASALGVDFSHQVEISGDDFALSSSHEEINVNTDEAVHLIWKHDGVAQSNKSINLSATRGTVPSSVTTDISGQASFMLSSATAGGTVVTAIAETGLTASMVREFVAVTPNYLSVQSERSNIGPEEQTTIFALVRDINDNPVKNQKVQFNIFSDTVNGRLSSSIATTDSLGRASVVYTSGNATGAKDGVVIDAVLQSNPAKTDRVTLTVGGRALRLVLGTDEKLSKADVFYEQRYGVIVTDSAGNPVAGKTVDFSLIPTAYYKGYMVCSTENTWVRAPFAPKCDSEDIDNDGRLDTGEDFNGSQTLDPTHTAKVDTNAMTDANGRAVVTVSYPQSQADWSRLQLVATISDEGTEYSESVEFDLNVLADDVKSCTISPPNPHSPYGAATSCESPD